MNIPKDLPDDIIDELVKKDLLDLLSRLGVGEPSRFGDGSDGDVIITGPHTLSRNMHFRNLTIYGSGKLITKGYKIHVRGTMDLTGASSGSITP